MMELGIGDAAQVHVAFLVYLDLMESEWVALRHGAGAGPGRWTLSSIHALAVDLPS